MYTHPVRHSSTYNGCSPYLAAAITWVQILICSHEFSGRYTHPLHIVIITTGGKILMHTLRCPYQGNASALRASRGVHNNITCILNKTPPTKYALSLSRNCASSCWIMLQCRPQVQPVVGHSETTLIQSGIVRPTLPQIPACSDTIKSSWG